MTRITTAWGLGVPSPLSIEKVFAVGATLRAGGYRSHKHYFSKPHSEAERSSAIEFSRAVYWAVKDAERACDRGFGGKGVNV